MFILIHSLPPSRGAAIWSNLRPPWINWSQPSRGPGNALIFGRDDLILLNPAYTTKCDIELLVLSSKQTYYCSSKKNALFDT